MAGFRKALVINPKDAVAHNNLGYALSQEGQLAEAAHHFREALRLAPGYAEARGNLQRVMAEGAPASAADAGALMKEGLELLYTRRDPIAAGTKFREVLEQNPTHYGATSQLATALDQAGKPAEARPLWEKVLTMAEGYKDAATARTARTRLARRP
jgi:Flp pilus assembly protein TadD